MHFGITGAKALAFFTFILIKISRGQLFKGNAVFGVKEFDRICNFT